jgi:adenine phosphoribosyltransferase
VSDRRPLNHWIRTIADFPRPGVQFRDLSPLIADAQALKRAVQELTAPYRDADLDAVAGLEARGFIFGALAAGELNLGFVPVRKAGKLPGAVESVSYTLEYGDAALEAHRDAFKRAARVLLVDDVLATGGTAAAGVELVKRLGASVVACAVVIELVALGGRARLPGLDVHSVVKL